jgi:hypothetical protein
VCTHTERLLLEEQEASIKEFEELGEIVELVLKLVFIPRHVEFETYIVQNDQLIGPSTLPVANGKEDAVPPDGGNQLLQEQNKQRAANECQVQVVHLEQPIELQGRSATHNLSAAEDDYVVGDEDNSRGGESGKGRYTLFEAEVLRLVAFDGLKGPLEDWP